MNSAERKFIEDEFEKTFQAIARRVPPPSPLTKLLIDLEEDVSFTVPPPLAPFSQDTPVKIKKEKEPYVTQTTQLPHFSQTTFAPTPMMVEDEVIDVITISDDEDAQLGNASQFHTTLVPIKPEPPVFELRYSQSQENYLDEDDFPPTMPVQHARPPPPPIREEEISSEEERPPSPVFDFSPPKATPSQEEEEEEEENDDLFPSQSVEEIDRKAMEDHLNKKTNTQQNRKKAYYLLEDPLTPEEYKSLGLEIPDKFQGRVRLRCEKHRKMKGKCRTTCPLRPHNLAKLPQEERLKVVKNLYLDVKPNDDNESSDSESSSSDEEAQAKEQWVGDPFYVNKSEKWYLSFTLGKETFRVGDVVTLHSGKKLPYVAKLLELYEQKSGEKKALVCWYYWPHETALPKEDHVKKELFSSTLVDTNPLGAIVGKIQLGDNPSTLKEGKEYFCHRYYDSNKKKAFPISAMPEVKGWKLPPAEIKRMFTKVSSSEDIRNLVSNKTSSTAVIVSSNKKIKKPKKVKPYGMVLVWSGLNKSGRKHNWTFQGSILKSKGYKEDPKRKKLDLQKIKQFYQKNKKKYENMKNYPHCTKNKSKTLKYMPFLKRNLKATKPVEKEKKSKKRSEPVKKITPEKPLKQKRLDFESVATAPTLLKPTNTTPPKSPGAQNFLLQLLAKQQEEKNNTPAKPSNEINIVSQPFIFIPTSVTFPTEPAPSSSLYEKQSPKKPAIKFNNNASSWFINKRPNQ